jgi:hypothetical protein
LHPTGIHLTKPPMNKRCPARASPKQNTWRGDIADVLARSASWSSANLIWQRRMEKSPTCDQIHLRHKYACKSNWRTASAAAMSQRMSQSSTGRHKFPLSRTRADAILETR